MLQNRLPENKKIVFFDLDDTLAPSKSSMSEKMSLVFSKLLDNKMVAIISGGAFEQFKKQVIDTLPTDTNLKNLYILPTSGAQLYVLENETWERKYAHLLSDSEVSDIKSIFEKIFLKFPEYKTHEPYGEIIENRGAQVTFSALGQLAPLDKKRSWDPDGKKRLEMLEFAKDDFSNYSARMGGTTTIDVSKKGIDKKFGIQTLLDYLSLKKEDAVFVGDKIVPGGNDYPAKEMGLDCVQVKDSLETEEMLEKWLTK